MNNQQEGWNPQNTAENNRKIESMPNVRVFYHKTGRAKYISHLDTMRCMQRSLKRANAPVWYTQGFNPHMYMTFALPLALGYESECEVMDLRLTQEVDFAVLKEELNAALPRDIQVAEIALQQNKPQTIAKASYHVSFTCENPVAADKAFSEFFAQEKLLVQKKTKKGMSEVDLKPEMELLSREVTEHTVVYTMTTTAGQKNFNPTLLTDLFLSQYQEQIVQVGIFRRKIFMEDGTEFC